MATAALKQPDCKLLIQEISKGMLNRGCPVHCECKQGSLSPILAHPYPHERQQDIRNGRLMKDLIDIIDSQKMRSCVMAQNVTQIVIKLSPHDFLGELDCAHAGDAIGFPMRFGKIRQGMQQMALSAAGTANHNQDIRLRSPTADELNAARSCLLVPLSRDKAGEG